MGSAKTGAVRTAAVLSIGDELTLGQTLDTNGAWISAELFRLGIRTTEHATVADDRTRLAEAFRRLMEANDIVIATGGLGPTADDLTREALADATGDTLVEDAAALDAVRAWFRNRPGGMPERNAVQAMRPSEAACLENGNGTAPGLLLEREGSLVACLPGPPGEMKPMFRDAIASRVRARVGGPATRTRMVLTVGLGESSVAEALGDLMDRDRIGRGEVQIGTTASRGIVTCRLIAEGADGDACEAALDTAEGEIRERIEAAAILETRRTGDDENTGDALERAVIDRLREIGQRFCTIESCTGGMVGQLVTAIPGSSDAYAGGWVTYANDFKSELVGVKPKLIGEFGAVSDEVACEMAIGGLRRAREADMTVCHSVAITGVAGPGGGSDAKPVGTVWIARASRDVRAPEGFSVESRLFRFPGDRNRVRDWAARTALNMLRLRLMSEDMVLIGEAG